MVDLLDLLDPLHLLHVHPDWTWLSSRPTFPIAVYQLQVQSPMMLNNPTITLIGLLWSSLLAILSGELCTSGRSRSSPGSANPENHEPKHRVPAVNPLHEDTCPLRGNTSFKGFSKEAMTLFTLAVPLAPKRCLTSCLGHARDHIWVTLEMVETFSLSWQRAARCRINVFALDTARRFCRPSVKVFKQWRIVTHQLLLWPPPPHHQHPQ